MHIQNIYMKNKSGKKPQSHPSHYWARYVKVLGCMVWNTVKEQALPRYYFSVEMHKNVSRTETILSVETWHKLH